MERELYDLMDWPEIEAVEYQECDHPHKILGCHKVKQKMLFTAFYPQAEEVTIVWEDQKKYTMEAVDHKGFFAAYVPVKTYKSYSFEIKHSNGEVSVVTDPYSFPLTTSTAAKSKQQLYERMGSHQTTINNVKGTLFTVSAPGARSVSVVGDFNEWDGRIHQMSRIDIRGVFELFIPEVSEGMLYKFEIRGYHGDKFLKCDPYAFCTEQHPGTASVVYNPFNYIWNDTKWTDTHKKAEKEEQPLLIYEMELSGFSNDQSYDEIAEEVITYCKNMGYTHVELMSVMEYEDDKTYGGEITSYFAPTSRYGTPKQLMKFVDMLHQNNLGVIFSWVPAYFSKKDYGLANFDGTCMYEHFDSRQSTYPYGDASLFNFSQSDVKEFLTASALFWVSEYHIDGLMIGNLPAMLYLDYGKEDGEWVANIYGGNENLEAVEWIKNLNTVLHKKHAGLLTIADDNSCWPKVTLSIIEGGLGFDYKGNVGWMSDFLDYMKTDSQYRRDRHGILSYGMVYHYSEKFLLPISHREVGFGKGTMFEKMPGKTNEKMANLRTACGFIMAHPGKKQLFMGEDMASACEWSMNERLDWDILLKKPNSEFQLFMKDLMSLYQEHPAMYALDYDTAGFEWLSTLDADHSVITFMRKCRQEELLFVYNFSNEAYGKYKVGVPYEGKYKEIFNSDIEKYGGEGVKNPRIKQSKAEEWDGRKNLIEVKIPSLGFAVFRCERS